MPEDQYFRPRNWAKWQDCRHKNAPWVKNFTDLLTDPDYLSLTPNQAVLLHRLWMYCGRVGKPLPLDCRFIGGQLNLHCPTVGKSLPVLLSKNFIELCARTDKLFDRQLADNSPPEDRGQKTETEERKKETPKGVSKERRATRLPDDWTLPQEWRVKLIEEGFSHDELERSEPKFRDYWIAISGQRGVKRNWLATFRNWLRTDRERSGRGGARTNGAGSSRQRRSSAALVGAGLQFESENRGMGRSGQPKANGGASPSGREDAGLPQGAGHAGKVEYLLPRKDSK